MEGGAAGTPPEGESAARGNMSETRSWYPTLGLPEAGIPHASIPCPAVRLPKPTRASVWASWTTFCYFQQQKCPPLIECAQKEALCQQNHPLGTSLVVQWVRLHAPNTGGPGSIPGWGTRSRMHAATRSPHAATKTRSSLHKQTNKQINK